MIRMLRGLRKFGLNYHDMPTMLRNVTIMLEHLTLDVDPRNRKHTSTTCWAIGILPYICMITFFLCYHYIYFVSMIWFVFVKCRETGDLMTAIVVFSCGIISQISILKLLNLMFFRKGLRHLVGDFLAADARTVPGTRFAANMKKKLREVKKRAMMLFIVIMVNGTMYIAKPFFMSGYEDSLELFGFENVTRTSSSPGYKLVFGMDCIAVYGVCYSSSAITALFIIFSGYIEAQMLALSHELTNIWKDAVEHCNSNSTRIITHIRRPSRSLIQLEDSEQTVFYGDNTTKIDTFRTAGVSATDSLERASGSNISNHKKGMKDCQDERNKYVRRRLEDISKSHSINVDLASQAEVVFRIAIASEFLVLSIGLVACLLGGLENTYIELPLILMSVGVDCVTGQRMIDASKEFERAVYDSKWENFDVINRKMILLVQRASQRTLKLSAGAVATLSLECFMNILKTIYSAYTTLRSTMK